MMPDLIPITTTADGRTAVSGRALHAFLEVSTRYDQWFARMAEYGLTDGEDFRSFLTESTGGRPSTDHALTIDAAKEIAMIQRSEKGKQARAYFLEIERRYKTATREMSRRELAQMVIDAEDRAELEAKRADVAETVVRAVEAADGITLREFHKHYFSEVTERDFFELLYRAGILIDQRASRTGRDGRPKSGKQHRHPTYQGKRWLYLHGSLDHDGVRREAVRVRPGSPEVAFAQHLADRHALPLNPSAARHLAKELTA